MVSLDVVLQYSGSEMTRPIKPPPGPSYSPRLASFESRPSALYNEETLCEIGRSAHCELALVKSAPLKLKGVALSRRI